jgi:amino acid transporter
MDGTSGLKRSLSLPLITFYGLGTILGAGIYVLISKVALHAGIYAPISFCISTLLALFTAVSYAELSSRFPRSAGEAVYVNEAFRKSWLSASVGWLVVLTGIVSAATIANGFVGYLHLFVDVPSQTAITLLVLGLGALAIWGINESVFAASAITLIEIGGLLLVLYYAGGALWTLPDRWTELIPPSDGELWSGIFVGAFIAFYAFIGFEDIVNVAEEVVDPRRNLPLAIFLAITISTVLYILIALVAVLSLPVEELIESDAPLATIVRHTGHSDRVIGYISLLAVVNGALVQIIMASRVVYGMALEGGALGSFAEVNPTTRTPIKATLLIILFVLLLALWLPLETLARSTSFIIITVFFLVNLSLVVIKRTRPKQEGAASYPLWVPVTGSVLCLVFLAVQIFG